MLATTYLGLPLSGPIIASAGPLTGRLDTLKQLEEAGAAAVVLPSLFEEEVVAEELHLSDMIDEGEHFAEFAGGVLPEVALPNLGVGRHLSLLEQAKAAVSIPVIASLNATHHGSWERYAAMMVDAGADAIELNLYAVAANPDETAAEVEARALDVIAAVAGSVTVPLAVKLSPYYSSLAHFAAAAVRFGADALVLFNRFYAPDIDLAALDVVPKVDLSSSVELRLPLRWLGILRAQLPVGVGLACTSGVHTGTDAVKALLVGADVACTTSAVLHHGPEYLATMLGELRRWLVDNDYESVAQLRGSMSASSVTDPSAFERSQYMAVVTSMRDRV
jgi:dihydroorotate dehydrogenase (fumarate)